MKYCCEELDDAEIWGLIHKSKDGWFVGKVKWDKESLIPDAKEAFMYLTYCPFCRKKL